MKTELELPLQQHSKFGAALRLLNVGVEVVDLPNAAPVQVVSRFGFRFVSRGPMWFDDTEEMTPALRAARLHVVNTDKACTIMTSAGYKLIMTPACVAELDLDTDLTDRTSRMKPKWRNSWRRSQNEALKIKQRRFDPQRDDWLLTEDAAQQRKKKYRALPHQLTLAYASCHPKDALLFEASANGEVAAAMLFLVHDPVVTYQIGWTNNLGRRLAAHNALLMKAADHFAVRGHRRLDLGTVDTDNAPGLARFKIGSGARIRTLGGTWLRMPRL